MRASNHLNRNDIIREASRSPSPSPYKQQHRAMAQPAQDVVGKAKGASGGIQGATSGILGRIEGIGSWIAAKGKSVLDSIFPPEARASFLSKLQSFMLKNPKISVSSQ